MNLWIDMNIENVVNLKKRSKVMNKSVNNILLRKKLVKDSNLRKELTEVAEDWTERDTLHEFDEYLSNHKNLEDIVLSDDAMETINMYFAVPEIETLSSKALSELIQFCKYGIIEPVFYMTNYISISNAKLPAGKTVVYMELRLIDTPISIDKFKIPEKFFLVLQRLFLKYNTCYMVINLDTDKEDFNENINKNINKYLENNEELLDELQDDLEEEELEVIKNYIKSNELSNKFDEVLTNLENLFSIDDEEDDKDDD